MTTVGYNGITHDFMVLNPLSGTHAARAAVAQAIAIPREALHSAKGGRPDTGRADGAPRLDGNGRKG